MSRASRYIRKLRDSLTLAEVGARTDNADNFEFWQEAQEELASGGTLHLGRGAWQFGDVVDTTERGIILRGSGAASSTSIAGGTKIIGTHNLGPVLKISEGDVKCGHFSIGASAGRKAGAADGGSDSTPCCGLLIEGPDEASSTAQVQRVTCSHINVQDQPGGAVMWSGETAYLDLVKVHAHHNLGTAFRGSRGKATGRVNEANSGIVRLIACRGYDNGGHNVLVGDLTDTDLPSYRVELLQHEGYRNGSDPSLLVKPYAYVLIGQNIEARMCGFGGSDPANDALAYLGGAWIAGRVIRLLNSRYNNTIQPVYVGRIADSSQPTRDIEINGMSITGPGLPFAYAVDRDTAVDTDGVKVVIGFDEEATASTYTEPLNLTAAPKGYWSESQRNIRADKVIEARAFKSAKTFTLADDTVQELNFGDLASGLLEFASNSDSTIGGVVQFRVGTTPHCVGLGATGTESIGTNVTLGTGALTNGAGDGTDTDLNVFTHTDNKLYIKNRRGGNRTITVTITCHTGAILSTVVA